MPDTAFSTVSTGVPPPPTGRVVRKLSGLSAQWGWALIAWLWFAIADALSGRAASGLTNRFNAEDARPLLAALFLIFLLVVGYSVFEALESRDGFSLRRAASLPRRPTAGREWALGVAIGWGATLFCVLPMAFGRSFHVRLWTEPRAFFLFAVHAATLIVAALALEIGLRGYPFQRLAGAVGAGWATTLLSLALGAAQWVTPEGTAISTGVTILFAVLLSLAWLRTHGLWVGWGLRAAWSLSIALLFGLPLRGDISFASLVQTRAIRPTWLTGNAFGPEGAALAIVALLIALVVLIRCTDDYAWEYTRPTIVAAGYAVDPPPPAAHVAMAQEAQEAEARPGSLVQILPSTAQSQAIDRP